MIRNFLSTSKTASPTPRVARTGSYFATLLVALAYLTPATDAFGQAGFLTRDPNVTVDMSVLEELGQPSTVAGQHLSNRSVVQPPVSFPPGTPPVSRLTGPLALQRFRLDPPPRGQVSVPPRPTAVQPPPRVVQAPPPVTPAPAAPAPAQVEVRAARPATPVAPTPVPPAPVPAPAPAPAVAAPAPAPQAAPKEKVDVAPPPPTTTVSAPPAPAPAEAPEPREPAPAPVSTPPLTPSPAGVAPTPPPVQTASTTDVSSLEPSFRVLFDDNSATISDTGRAPLEELSKKMQESEDLRVQLLAYASGTSETASQARRLSLSRALAVRSFLISQGVRSTRMDVRALGNKAESGPADRVDAVLVER